MEKEALYYTKLDNNVVKCVLCPIDCVINIDKYGNCNARKNINGKLYSMVYGKPCAVSLEPIEKKPLYHFMPGKKVFSIGTAGCNLHCKFCQNYTTSQSSIDEVNYHELTPKEIVEKAISSGCEIIAYTYNEPFVFYEYTLETAKLAKKKGIKNVIVSNGFINEKPLKELLSYLDAANIDLKSFDNEFYIKYCKGFIKPILNTLKLIHDSKVHLEITNLIIDRLNDNMEEIDEMCKWIHKNLGSNVPMHFSASYPCYKMLDIIRTPADTLRKAKKTALKNKINYIYIGNTVEEDNNTYCLKCKNVLIQRNYFDVIKNDIVKGKCKSCKEKVSGVWD